MASVVLSEVGEAIGSEFGSYEFAGMTISGAQIGGAIGASVGTMIDASLMPAILRSGTRLADITIQSSTEGRAIPAVYGRVRLAGQIIWASRFSETSSTSGGKGMGGRSVETTAYAYSVSFAVGLCAGPVSRIARIWVDGNLLDPTLYTIRSYLGRDDQMPDPAIVAIEGAANAPAFRGLCYVVFEDMPLASFGNRIPQLQFEVIHTLALEDADALENRLTSVALIPGAGEFVYAPDVVQEDDGLGTSAPLNAHNASGGSDWSASLDELQGLAPNLAAVSLVVGWFGNDLRAGSCIVQPGVEEGVCRTVPETWSVDGTPRQSAYIVSRHDDRPAYGGTPSDDSVKAALADLKRRGLAVTFYPFVFMDIASGNALPNPYAAGVNGQPAYPWRGRITVSPAPDQSGTADQTAAAATQVNAFFANGYRRMVLHYARLCAEAGGVEAFLIGSELKGLTQARSDAATYPAVAALKQLAADVRAILPNAKLGYAADWSEFPPHQLGGGRLRFQLDPLWADPNIDFIGLDNYWPLADWREGGSDAASFAAIYDPAYLASNIQGGEDFDWYYASDSDRASGTRTPISDGLGKPFVWRAKDIRAWWSSLHYDRPNGAEPTTPTAWVAQSKPIRFTELGCPAVDKGANQPNVFHDPKSAESAFPYFSTGVRDDLIQRRALEAQLTFWRDPANNPVSTLYHAPMLETARTSVWCWDARPYPFFPTRSDLWGDGDNYPTGHWLNGRLGSVPLALLVRSLCHGVPCDVSALDGVVTGFAVTETMSVREALAALMAAYFFDAVESEGVLRFVPRGSSPPLGISEDNLVLAGTSTCGYQLLRAQEADLAARARLTYVDADTYDQAVAEARRLVVDSERVATANLPLVFDAGRAAAIADSMLQDGWVMREGASFALPPSLIALDPTDEVVLSLAGRAHRFRIIGIEDAAARTMRAVATDPSLYDAITGAARVGTSTAVLRPPGRPLVVFADLPLLTDDQNPSAPFAAAFADPWPGRIDIYKDYAATPSLSLTRPASIGETVSDFWSGPTDRWDRVNGLDLKLYRGTLQSVEDRAVFAGANAVAVQNGDGAWEIVQFSRAELVAPGQWHLSRLLRGRQASEHAMRSPLPAGARVVVLDVALKQIPFAESEARLSHSFTYGPSGRPVTETSFQTVSASFTAAGLIPPPPCHVRFGWNASGDLTLSWLRRDRAPAAAQLLRAETPQSDPTLFDLEILVNGAVVRSFSNVPQHSQVYTAAQQAADFPSGLPNPLIVRLYQRSSVLGRGRPKTENLYVR